MCCPSALVMVSGCRLDGVVDLTQAQVKMMTIMERTYALWTVIVELCGFRSDDLADLAIKKAKR